MEVLYPRCAGLDVHKDSVVACVRCVSPPAHQEVRQFATTTTGLLALGDWLAAHGCTHVAMEATGVYWKPVWHLLEGRFDLVLANAQHVRNVPGRKTDVHDASGSPTCSRTGSSAAASCRPRPFRNSATSRARASNWSGRSRSTPCGFRRPWRTRTSRSQASCPASWAQAAARCSPPSSRVRPIPSASRISLRATARNKRRELIEALRGHVTDHHRAMLRLHLGVIAALVAALGEVDATLGKALAPIQTQADLLTTMPGVSDIVAQVVLAEIGVDMTRFPTAAHLVSWAGLCPRNDESAGKRRSTRVRKSGQWLKTTLVTSAWSAVRVKDSYLRAQFLRIKARRGPKKAILAVAASMLTAVYYMLRDGVEYRDLGPHYLDQRDRTKTIRRLLQRLHHLGYQVAAAPA